ncbi:DNA-directed RNA polymerase subunit A' [Candidatus Woesearchaeota archaeon]|jgi:DNA-directed RNA polymerase subunit A'|nr:DNA-directed RNA polymerase subunit A' [Candidatus Woesearchaeota archaeon]MBT6023169.1 DNA-directed RNA polymerase subunit A' [Candidatus Woesearchaeota archaeon]
MKQVISKNIESIQFGLLSPSEIKKLGKVQVITPEIYDSDGYPVERGLMDPEMGVLDPGMGIKKWKIGAGNFGYISLSRPVIHILFRTHIYNFLRSTCSSCGRITLTENKIEGYREKLEAAKQVDVKEGQKVIRNMIKAASSVKACPHCNAEKEKITFKKPQTYFSGKDERIWPTDINDHLEKIPDSDVEIFGIDPEAARPEWMVLTTLLVPPIRVRPSITLQTGERSEDDLTHKLSDVVRVNQRLMENINAGAPEIIVEDLWDLLQYHITTYFNNNIAGVPPARHRTRRQLKTLAARLKGKAGIFRSNLAGKRVNFCARSVISPDSYIDINEVGVPKAIAKELTIGERVTEWNIDWLKGMIKNFEGYPGANYIINLEGRRKKITEESTESILDELTFGYVVERNIINGDVVLFNRQPSLHRMSMMGHRVKVVPGKTLRINPAVTIPYNADFDGDEMNLHVPQSEEARAEAEAILLLQNQLITPRYGLSIIGAMEDSILGIYYLTKDRYLTRRESSELLMSIGIDEPLPKPAKKSKEELWHGAQIFSMLLPKTLNFKRKGKVLKGGKVVKGEVEIIKGQLKQGCLIDSSFIGPEGGILIHKLFIDHGTDESAKFINRIIHLGIAVSRMVGLTMSFNDFDIDPSDKTKIQKLIEIAQKKAQELIKEFKANNIKPMPGMTVTETFEAKMQGILSTARTNLNKIIEEKVDESTHLINSARAGAGDKILNIVLMSGFVGQTDLRGDRINFGYKDRTIAHFDKGDLGPRAHGFITNGYADGLDAVELFFTSITGRDNFMDTAMRTPKSGYMQRRLVNAMQDLKVAYDGTVRDSSRKIIQFSFGGDNVDVSKSDKGGILRE